MILILFFLASLTNLADIQDATSITLALKTLGSFDFEGEQLIYDLTTYPYMYLCSLIGVLNMLEF